MATQRRPKPSTTTTAASTLGHEALLLDPGERARLERVAAQLRSRRRQRGSGGGDGGGGGGKGMAGVRYLSEESEKGDVQPPFPLHDEWTPCPPRPVESHRPWDAQDALVFAPPETYLFDPQQGRLRRVDYTIPTLASDAPPPVVSRRRYEDDALVGRCRIIVPKTAYHSMRAPPFFQQGEGEGEEEDMEPDEFDTFNLEAVAEAARAQQALAAALNSFPREEGEVGAEAATSVLWEAAAAATTAATAGGGGGGGRQATMRRPIYAHM